MSVRCVGVGVRVCTCVRRNDLDGLGRMNYSIKTKLT